jgi:hypothetical protein
MEMGASRPTQAPTEQMPVAIHPSNNRAMSRGELTELEVALALVRDGRAVLRPLSSGLRYDLAIDGLDGSIIRVQCKTGKLKDGYLAFRVCSADARRPNGVPYQGQIEAFGVFCPQNGNSYLIPMNVLGPRHTTVRLRVTPPRNGQIRGIRYAREFEIGPARRSSWTRPSGSGISTPHVT